MARPTRHQDWVRCLSFGLGLALVLLLVASWRVPRAAERSRVDVRFIANLTGQLDVSPTGPVLRATGLEPGPAREAARGEVTIRNLTPVTLSVRVRGLPPDRDLDDLLRVAVGPPGRRLFLGSLGEFRRWSNRSLTLSPGERATLELRTWVAEGENTGYAGSGGDVTLELSSRAVGR